MSRLSVLFIGVVLSINAFPFEKWNIYHQDQFRQDCRNRERSNQTYALAHGNIKLKEYCACLLEKSERSFSFETYSENFPAVVSDLALFSQACLCEEAFPGSQIDQDCRSATSF